METFGYFPFDQNSSSVFPNWVKWYGNFLEKFPQNPRIDQLPEFEPLDLKFREQHHMKRKFKVKKSKYKKLGTNFVPRQCRWKTFIWRNNAFSFAGTFTFGKKGLNYCVWLEQESLLMKSYQCSAHSYDGQVSLRSWTAMLRYREDVLWLPLSFQKYSCKIWGDLGQHVGPWIDLFQLSYLEPVSVCNPDSINKQDWTTQFAVWLSATLRKG